jgi:hypothetical protein
MNRWKYIYFFDKNGKYYNFEYDAVNDMWLGDIFLPEVSTDLFEVGQIFVLQKFVEQSSNAKLFGYPHSYEFGEGDSEILGESNCEWKVEWETDDPSDIFIFQFDNNQTVSGVNMDNKVSPVLQKYDEIYIPLRYDPSQTIDSEGYIVTDLIKQEAIQINFAINSSEENTFKRTLIIRDVCTDSIIAKFTVYGETIEEDERLKIMTENLGRNISFEDSLIFRDTDVNEHLPNFIEINNKRKELMLEGHNIYPYIGSYKGLINAIKFFGYDNLQVKEFWKNINKSSPRYGKYIQSTPIQMFEPTVDYNDGSITLPNKNFKKTNMFSLIYKINSVKQGVYDFENLPLTEETFDYTTEEILIKLFGLKKKLEKEFLPLNAHIIDIIGEADFFGSINITNTISRNDKRNIQVGIQPDFKVTPNECVHLDDLRTFLTFCFRQEAMVGQAVVEFCNAFIRPIGVTIGGPEPSRNLLIGTYVDGDPLPRPAIGPDVNSVLGKPIGGQYFTIADIADVYMSFFSRYAPNFDNREGEIFPKLADRPDIPIGALVVLENDSFETITWDNINSTYNQIADANGIQTFDLNPQGGYPGDIFTITDPITGTGASFTFSVSDDQETLVNSLASQLQILKDNQILPWLHWDISVVDLNIYGKSVRIFGDDTQRIVVSIDKHPLSGAIFNKINSSKDLLYRWDNIGNSDFIEIEWTIYKEKTDVSSEFFYNVRGPIKQYGSLPLTLPFIGTYAVEMKLYDLYNNASSLVKTDFICVEPKEVEYSGWYQSRKESYTWDTDGKWKWKDYGTSWDLPIEPSVTWEDKSPSLYESLDRANAILNNFGLGVSPDITLLNFQDNGNLSFSGPYFWNNLEAGTWNDTYHLWWDMTSITGDTPAFFQFKEIELNSYLTIKDLKGNVGTFYFDSTVDTLAKAAAKLNLSNDPIISKYVYNVVYDAAEDQKFVQAVARYFGVYGDWESVDILDKDGERVCESTGSPCESLIYRKGLHKASNPLWGTAKFIDDGLILPKLTWTMFVYDKCKIKGKDKPVWTIKNKSNPAIPDIYFESKYLTYLFKHPGNYEIGLELKDSNGNKYKKDRNILVIK